MRYLTVLVLCLSFCACSVVNPGERGIRVSLGKASPEVLDSGAYLWIPFLYGLTTMNVQVQKSEVEASASSKDMQEIKTHIAVTWSITSDRVVSIYKNIGDEQDILNRIITPAVNEIMKSAVSKRTAEEALIKRMEMKKDIDDGLVARLTPYGITVADVNIINFTFSSEFTQAIERKQIAEQKAKESEYVALEAVQKAKAEVNRARGQAESQQLLRATLTKEILQQRAIEKWDGKFPQIMGSQSLPLINFKAE